MWEAENNEDPEELMNDLKLAFRWFAYQISDRFLVLVFFGRLDLLLR